MAWVWRKPPTAKDTERSEADEQNGTLAGAPGLLESTFEWEEGTEFGGVPGFRKGEGRADGHLITLDRYELVEPRPLSDTWKQHDAPVEGVDARLYGVEQSRPSYSTMDRSRILASDGQWRSDPQVPTFAGESGYARAAYINQCLDYAVLLWWEEGELPPIALLRDGLFLVQTGHVLNDSQLTLLARASLAYRKGMLTAIRAQRDPKQTALLLNNALLDAAHPFPLSSFWYLWEEDSASERWFPLLLEELYAESRSADGARQRRAQRVYQRIRHLYTQPESAAILAAFTGRANDVHVYSNLHGDGSAFRLASVWGFGLVGLLLVILGGWWFIQQERMDMAQVPAGTFVVNDAPNPGQMRVAILSGFSIDETEVTNQAYRRCYEQGGCPWPAAVGSSSHADYFTDPAYNDHPVVNVSWSAADRYCRWRGGRLPTEEEWEVAASAAIGTGKRFVYPWGDTFNAHVANSMNSRVGDTQRVGNYRPAGDSTLGVADMAGNVAEWTGSRDPFEPEKFAVKGGSFRDGPEEIAAGAREIFDESFAAEWIGFRCARS